MTEPVPILPDLNLQPGELYLARGPSILRTILGSCVGVTFWSARLGAGALCHGVLPRCPRAWPPGFKPTDGHRYVDFSIRYLAQQFDTLGATRNELVVKVFGGADVLHVAETRRHRPTVGDRKSTRLNSSHLGISYAVFCLKKNVRCPVGAPHSDGQTVSRSEIGPAHG